MKTNLLLLCLLCYCSSGYAQENLQPLVDKIVFSYVTAKANCGLAVAIVTEKGEQIFTYGETEKGNGIKPGAASLFETGEITSLFTTTLLSVASYEGTLDLNDEVQKYFPATIHIPVYEEIICAPIDEQHPVAAEQDRHTVYYCFADPSYHPKQMLLCDLATNTSGLPAYPDNLHKNLKKATAFDGYTLTDLYQFLNDYQSSYPTGLHYKFSPLGIAMLGNGLAWKSGVAYDALLKQKVLAPLHLQHTFIKTSAEPVSFLLQGHDSKGKKITGGDFGAMSPALGLCSSAEDMALFLKENLTLSASPIQVPLTGTHNPRVAITDDKKLRGSYSALGWVVTPVAESKAVNAVWKDGTTNGFASYIGFIQESKVGVVVLSNSANSVTDIGKEILQVLYGEKLKLTVGSSNK